MKIDTKYYGEIDYTKDELVVFPDGLFGFPSTMTIFPSLWRKMTVPC